MAILFSTLGEHWEIPFEALAFTSFDENFDLFEKTEKYENIKNLRIDHIKKPVDEIVIFSTDQNKMLENIDELKNNKYFNIINSRVKRFSIYILDNIPDISSNDDVFTFENMVFAVISRNKIENPNKPIYLCIAGGRKTMSSSLHNAAHLLGADLVFHIIIENNKNKDVGTIKENIQNKDASTIEIDKEIAKNLNTALPVIVGKYPTNDLFFDKESENYKRFKSLIDSFDKDCQSLNYDLSSPLFFKVEKSQHKNNDIRNFIINQFENATIYYTNSIDSTEDTFKTLFNLRKEIIQKLKNTKIGIEIERQQEELEMIKKLPKTDLHCHLGGVLNPSELIELANNMKNEIFNEIKKSNFIPDNLNEMMQLIENSGGLKKFKIENLRKSYLILYFISLFEGDENKLRRYIFKDYLDERLFKNIGIEKYEKIGDIQGSSILQSSKAIEFVVEKCIKKAIESNVKHLEIRCSPINYSKEDLNDFNVLKTILQTMDNFNEKYNQNISLSLIIIASRHGKMSDVYRNIELISSIFNANDKRIKSLFHKYFKGIDLAGDESKGKPEEFRNAFLNLMNYNINVTIHAGETQGSDSIWQAIYHLNADRIGHGLKLNEDISLLEKIREKKIAIELCPSSNYQIGNFKDNYFKDSIISESYPLKSYLDKGLRVSINTDNPGISKTQMNNEILKAARMTEGGLSLWDILKILKMGFKSAFIDYDQRLNIYKSAEKDIDNFIESFTNQKSSNL